jgi:hypothetical protein
MADLLGEDVGLAEIHKLYRCHDRLLEHKQALFDHLVFAAVQMIDLHIRRPMAANCC